ncbi:MAG: M3 family oligoendopeptidase [Clostridia bacterium]|nr:M3 family oligoendopeptidase [Clostridia bacterium]
MGEVRNNIDGKFRDLKYERPDLKKARKDFAEYAGQFKAAATFEAADAAFLGFQRIMESVTTQNTIASIRNTMNMKDEFYDAEIKFFNREMPKLMMTLKKAVKAVLASPFRPQLEEKYGSHMFKDFEVQQRLIKLTTVLPSIRENNLGTEYSKTAAACSVEFMGEKCNFYGLLRHMQSTDREERRAAFEAWAGLYESVSDKLDAQYAKLVKTRSLIARRLGFKNYIDYVYLARGRYDYDAQKVAEFREAVRKYITPLCDRLFREQAGRLGIDKLEWYDESLCYPDGNALPAGTPEELTEKARLMYEEMSPETGEFFNFMTEHELFDFVTRENKHLGGYCTFLPDYKAPFIFSNFNGTSADIDVLTHEAGHAFEAYYASRRLPLAMQAFSTSEIDEIHSMTMELFAYPYMERFFGEKTDKYIYAHFTDAIKTIPYLVSVDEFQHRVFENPGSTSADWRRFWREIEAKYMPWRSYGGNAWASYLKLCGLGGMYGYFETLKRADIPMPLEPETVKELATFAGVQAEKLKENVT